MLTWIRLVEGEGKGILAVAADCRTVGAPIPTVRESAGIITVTIYPRPERDAWVRSAYLEQVRRIAPPQLYGRDTELAELAAFCTEPGQGTYMWWRGPAWAGKSALMSWFVLHPPPGVQVVSFFVTARLKAKMIGTPSLTP
jgi:hypothetical protein